MSKDEKHVDIRPKKPVHVELPKCCVCGQHTGELPGKAGPSVWHAACEVAHPDVIAKAKARA